MSRYRRLDAADDIPPGDPRQHVVVDDAFMLGVEIALGFLVTNFVVFLFVVLPIWWLIASS